MSDIILQPQQIFDVFTTKLRILKERTSKTEDINMRLHMSFATSNSLHIIIFIIAF